MGLARRLATVTTWTVVASATLVGVAVLGADALGASRSVQLGAGLLAAGVALLLGQLLTGTTLRPWLDRTRSLVAGIRRLADVEGRSSRLPELGDEEGARLAEAVNQLVDTYRGELATRDADVRLLKSLIERSPNGVLVCTRDGRIRTLNDAFRSLFEIRGDPVGRLPTEVLVVPEVQEIVDLAREGRVEGEIRTVSGIHDVVLRPILTDGGEVGVLAVDISRYRAAERARTEFVANVSHELRTPMAAIIGYAETLAMDADRMPEDLRPMLDALARNSKRLRDTFEGLMHLARVEARAEELAVEPLRLEPLVVQAVVPAVDAAGRVGVDFEVDCPDEIAAHTNAEALDVILGNLAMNAVKYTRPPGRVLIRVHERGDEVRIDVKDTGIGIDPAHQTRIFERFFRVDEGRAREIGGSGLGLAMVKHLALATGARVSVESRVGEGSTFTVHLPRADAVVFDGEEAG